MRDLGAAEVSTRLVPAEVGTKRPEWYRGGGSVASSFLRRTLFVVDGLAVVAAWAMALLLPGGAIGREGERLLVPFVAIVAVMATTLALIGTQRLYWSRVCNVATEETIRLLRVAVMSGVAALAASALVPELSTSECLAAAGLSFVTLRVGRGSFRSWIQDARRRGRYTHPVVLVGDNDEARDLYRLLADHPEIGFRVCGIVGHRETVRRLGLPVPWLGEVDEAAASIEAVGANGSVVAVTSLSSSELNELARTLFSRGIHLHLSNGLQGIDPRRLRVQLFAREPMTYIEPATLAPWQAWAKRSIDLVVASAILLVTTPLMITAAVAILVIDGRPVFFRQQRVGRHRRPFTILKFRTMVKDAEEHLVEVRDQNYRSGPLFKAEADPRVTRVGRLLRDMSIDELPQLFNVFRGEMSLVGPRPALPSEIAEFDDQLMARHEVAPGITGLWQIEARDNPSFSAYRRLDLHYAENWSVFLDLTIIVGTVRLVLVSVLRSLFRRIRRRVTLPAEEPSGPAPLPGGLHGAAEAGAALASARDVSIIG